MMDILGLAPRQAPSPTRSLVRAQRSSYVAALLALVCLTWLAACQLDDSTPTDSAESGSIATAGQAIVNGTADPQTITLTDGEILSIGWLHRRGDPGDNFCTATLVAPDMVVTAQHCVGRSSASDVGFSIGDRPSDPTASFGLNAIATHPSRDMALLILDEDATAAVEGLTPIPINTIAVDDDDVGTAVDAAGYGQTYNTNPEGRWFAMVYIDEVTNDEIIVDGRGEQGICYGDSGGPIIWEGPRETGVDGPVVLAVESWGDESCVGIDHLTRLDVLWDDFITPISNGELPPDPCEGIGSDGVCEGDVYKWCRRGNLRQVDCAELGTNCGQVSNGDFGCTCGDLSFEGRCDGNVVEYCDDGAYRAIDCDRFGGYCAYAGEDTGYFCVEDPPEECAPGTEEGLCQGTVLVTCSQGVTETRNCGNDGLACVAGLSGATCEAAEGPDDGPDVELPDTPELPTPTGPDVDEGGTAGRGGTDDGCTQAGAGSTSLPVAGALLGLVALSMRRRRK